MHRTMQLDGLFVFLYASRRCDHSKPAAAFASSCESIHVGRCVGCILQRCLCGEGQVNRTVCVLNLRQNYVGDAGATRLAQARRRAALARRLFMMHAASLCTATHARPHIVMY